MENLGSLGYIETKKNKELFASRMYEKIGRILLGISFARIKRYQRLQSVQQSKNS